MWYQLLTLIKKELQAILSSPDSRRILTVPVILQLVLFSFAATLEVKNSTLAIFNQDGGASSIELIQRLSATKAFPHILMVYSEAEMQRHIDNQDALLAIRVPADFSRNIAAGRNAIAQAIIDGRRSNSAQIAFGYALQVVQQYAAEQYRQPAIAQLSLQNLYNPNLDYTWYVLPCLIGIITTIGCLIVTALSLAREREEGTFEQLLVSPLTPAYIMVGKAIPGMLVAIFQGSIIAVAAVWGFGVPFSGSIALLYLSLLCYGFSLTGFGLFISAISKNQQQAFLGVFGFMTPAVILSGYIAPVENMPLALRIISALDPLSYVIVVIKGIFLKAFTFAQVWPYLWPLLALGSLTLALAYLTFRLRSTQ